MLDDIKAAARRQLVADGAAAISLRAIARELGVVSSAVYRYVASRDELLTMLIIDAYNAVGDVAEAAVAVRGTVRARWMRLTKAIRTWAVDHPHDYALIYGSPVPGYEAPPDTISPALRVSLVGLGLLLGDAIADTGGRTSVPRAVHADFETIRELVPGASDDVLSRALMAWTMMFGTISYELGGHLHNVITDYDAFFELQMSRAADLLFGAS